MHKNVKRLLVRSQVKIELLMHESLMHSEWFHREWNYHIELHFEVT